MPGAAGPHARAGGVSGLLPHRAASGALEPGRAEETPVGQEPQIGLCLCLVTPPIPVGFSLSSLELYSCMQGQFLCFPEYFLGNSFSRLTEPHFELQTSRGKAVLKS